MATSTDETADNTQPINKHTMNNTQYRNLSAILKGGKTAEVVMRLPNAQNIVIVESPRKLEAYLVRPAVGTGDARGLLVRSLDTHKSNKAWQRPALLQYLRGEFPEGVTL
jgi:hypothetical protein